MSSLCFQELLCKRTASSASSASVNFGEFDMSVTSPCRGVSLHRDLPIVRPKIGRVLFVLLHSCQTVCGVEERLRTREKGGTNVFPYPPTLPTTANK